MILDILNKNKEKRFDDKKLNLKKKVALLIHAAKIDENYTDKEKKLVLDFINLISEKKLNEEEINRLIKDAEEYENNSNQILEYTQEAKKMDLNSKKMIIEFLWKIILSDDKSDVYESTLMRRICGLLYLPDKLSGEIKLNILKKNK